MSVSDDPSARILVPCYPAERVLAAAAPPPRQPSDAEPPRMHPATASDTHEPSGDGTPPRPTTQVPFGQARQQPPSLSTAIQSPAAGSNTPTAPYTSAATAVARVTADRITNDAGLVQF